MYAVFTPNNGCLAKLVMDDEHDKWLGLSVVDRVDGANWPGAGSERRWTSVVLGDSSKSDECLNEGRHTGDRQGDLPAAEFVVCAGTELVSCRHGFLALLS